MLPSNFWDTEATELDRALGRLLVDVFLAGGKSGEALLPKAAQVLLDWDIINEAALAWLKQYRFGLIRDITATTRRQTENAIRDWIESGAKLDDLKRSLVPIFGKERAGRIAVTEVTRTYAGGNMAAWKSTGLVTGKRWQTANDERVCPECGPLNGQMVEIDANFSSSPDAIGAWSGKTGIQLTDKQIARFSQSTAYMPPLHVNCRCFLVPFVGETSLTDELNRELGL